MLIYISHKTATYIFQKLRLVYRTNRDLYRTKLPFIHRTNCNLYIAHSATYISHTVQLIYRTHCDLYIIQIATYISHKLQLIYRTHCDLYIVQTATYISHKLQCLALVIVYSNAASTICLILCCPLAISAPLFLNIVYLNHITPHRTLTPTLQSSKSCCWNSSSFL